MPDRAEIEKNGWTSLQDALAESAGLAILLVDGKQPPALAVSNNDSICRVVQSSEAHAHRCQPYCGAAFDNAMQKGEAFSYRCHAGLNCVAAPLNNEKGTRPLVAIVGRAFLKTADYRDLTERVWAGDLQDLSETELFENVLLANSSRDLERLAARLQNLNEKEAEALAEFVNASAPNPREEPNEVSGQSKQAKNEVTLTIEEAQNHLLELEDVKTESKPQPESNVLTDSASETVDFAGQDFAQWQAFTGSLLGQTFKQAALKTLQFAADNFGFSDLAWIERRENGFKTLLASGRLLESRFGVSLDVADERLTAAIENETSLKLERKNAKETVELFPLVVEDEIKSAIVVGDDLEDENLRKRLVKFCRMIALRLEVANLREELARNAKLTAAVQRFGERLKAADANNQSENYFDLLTAAAGELVGAKRASLLVFDENEQVLRAVAAIGAKAADIKRESGTAIGERVARNVLQAGKATLITDIKNSGLPLAPAEREYQSKSFISLPVALGTRKIGVLNLTEKAGGAVFDEADLNLLESIAPQIAIAVDRAALRQKAGEYEIASITDPLTGLRNRRFLEGRLDEEIKRTTRHGYPMSFMMIDVDNFKSYNDTFGHQAGDDALKITAQCLRAALRSSDVAARYGGEEFSILLPQTTSGEAQMIAERIRRRVESADIPNRNITISIGIAAFSQHCASTRDVIEAADRALYKAKHDGKNRVRVSPCKSSADE